MLPELAAELVRLRVVSKSGLPLASDVRRTLRFAEEMRRLQRHTVPLFMVLFFERAWRDAAISRKFLHHLSAEHFHSFGVEATWKAI